MLRSHGVDNVQVKTLEPEVTNSSVPSVLNLTSVGLTPRLILTPLKIPVLISQGVDKVYSSRKFLWSPKTYALVPSELNSTPQG